MFQISMFENVLKSVTHFENILKKSVENLKKHDEIFSMFWKL